MNADIQHVSAILQEQWERMKERRAETQQVLSDIDNELRSVEKALRALRPDLFESDKPVKEKAIGTRMAIGTPAVRRIAQEMWSRPDHDFSGPELAQTTGYSIGFVDAAIGVLRAEGFCRAIGRIPHPLGKQGSVMGFRVAAGATIEPFEISETLASASHSGKVRDRIKEIWDVSFGQNGDKEWTQTEIRELTGAPRKQLNNDITMLLKNGLIVRTAERYGTRPSRYKAVDGASL